MKHTSLLSLFLLLPAVALAQPEPAPAKAMPLGGTWKVLGHTDGTIGLVTFVPRSGEDTYRVRFLLGDGSRRFLNAHFDGTTLRTYRGDSLPAATTLPASSPGASGRLEDLTGDGDADAETTEPEDRVGTYALSPGEVSIEGRRSKGFTFRATSAVGEAGLAPVRRFARPAVQLRIVGPSEARVGEEVSFSAVVSGASVPGKLHWSVRGPNTTWRAKAERAKVRMVTPGTVTVSCRLVEEGGWLKTSYQVTHQVEVRPAFDSIKIVGLTYRSDHGVLKDHDGGWGDGGKTYPEPEWTPSRSAPITHELGEKLRVRLGLTVEPKNAALTTVWLRGVGPGGLQFGEQRIRVKGGRVAVDLESRGELPREIREQDIAIRWSYSKQRQGERTSLGETQTKAFLTLGDPGAPDRRKGITLKRMRQAVKAISGAGSLDSHAIAKHVIGQWSHFNLDVVYWNAWELGDDKRDPTTGELVGADCQTIVRYTENVLRMAGVPGKAEFIVVWAKVKKPGKARANPVSEGHMGNPRQYHNDHFRARPERAGWVAYLIDGNDRPNNYEAALRFTHEGQKLYYPGGVQAVMSNPNQVLRVFQSMSWWDGSKVRDAIVRY